jgi:integrase/recombinase XerD
MQNDIERFLAHLSAKTSSSQNTVAAYRNDLSQLFQFCQEQIWIANPLDASATPDGTSGDWASVTGTRIAAFIISLKEKGYAATTIARKIAAVKSFFHFLTAEGLLQVDPTENLDSPRIEKTLPRSLTRDEISTLLVQPEDDDAPEGLRDNAMLKLLWSTGMRVSELVALNVDDLDLSSGYVRCLGKANRERIVPVSLDAQSALEQYLNGGRTTLLRRRDESALFVNHRGERLTRQGFWLILKGYARRANLSADVTPQTLRHSFAINQLDQHTDLRSLQELLGHASITTTQVYAQVAGTRARSAQKADAAPVQG